MNRSLLIGILATIALISSIAIYFYFNNIKIKKIAATEAIPADAFLICKTQDILGTWKSVKSASLWKDLTQNSSVAKTAAQLEQLIQTIQKNQPIDEAINDNTTFVSLHQVNNELAFFIVNEMGSGADLEELATFIAGEVKGSYSKRSFEKTVVVDVVDGESNPLLTLCYRDDLLFCSPQGVLVEEAIRRLKFRLPQTTKGFEQVNLMADANDDATLFINFQKLYEVFNLTTKPEFAHLFKHLGNFANWGMLGVNVSTDAISFKGVTYTDDSLFQFLDLFKNQTPKQLTLQQYMPANTAFALQMGFTDYMKFNEELNEYLQAHQKSEAYNLFTDSIENRYQIDISKKILSFIDGEAALTMMEPINGEVENNLAAFIRFKNAGGMGLALKSAVEQMHKKGETDSVSLTYNGVEIDRIKLANFLKLYYGEIMSCIYSPYFARLNDVFVFANNINTLKIIIDEYKLGNTLANYEHFKSYEKELAQSNNINLFISPVKAFPLAAKFASEKMFSTLNTHQFDFKKFEYLNIQFSNTNNKAFYTQVNYKYNTITAGETQQLWLSKLDTAFNMVPQVVYSTTLRQQMIFVQDVKNTLYCLSASGNLIWRSKLSAPIVGDFITVDARKNGSNCYLFATEKQLFLVDEEGVSLPNYPIGLPGKMVLPFSLVSTSNDSNEYIYAPLENSRIVGYYINGKSIPGFNPKKLTAKLTAPIAHFVRGSQTHLYSTDVQGNLLVFNLKGKQLNYGTEVTASIYTYVNQPDSMVTLFNAIDSTGNITMLTFDSLNSLTKIKPVGKVISFKRFVTSSHISGNQDVNYLLQSSSQAVIYNNQFEKLMELSVTDTLFEQVYFTHNYSGKVMIALSKPRANEYYWYDLNGKLYPDFPIKGTNRFGIGDVLGTRNNCLIGGDGANNIFLYKLK